MIGRLVALAAILAGVGAPLSGQTTPRQPTDKWVVNFADAQCVASRSYGTKDNLFQLVLKAPPVGDIVQVTIVRHGGMRNAAQYDGSLRFDGNDPHAISLLEFDTGGQRSMTFNLPASQVGAMSAARTMRISGTDLIPAGGEYRPQLPVDESLTLSQTAPVLKLLDDCAADLRTAWNVSDAIQIDQNRELEGLLKATDFPSIAFERQAGGQVEGVLLFNESGRAVDCTVSKTSGTAVLDAQTCSVFLARAKVDPPRGADGRPTKSGRTYRVKWTL